MQNSRFGTVINELFQTTLITYLILLLLEALQTGFVSNVFNTKYLLVLVVVSGILKLLPLAEKKLRTQWDHIDFTFHKLNAQIRVPAVLNENEFYLILITSLCGGTVIYFKIENIGRISILISAVTAIIILLLFYLIFTDNDEEE